MSRVLDSVRRRRTPPAATVPAAASEPDADLRRRRDELAERVAGLTWDLGGLTYEMAIRDHFRVDVLVRRAAILQEADAELGEVERLLAAAEEGLAGTCRSCGAPHSRGATYCWRCGQPLMLEARSAAAS
jgi:hypothetical protein